MRAKKRMLDPTILSHPVLKDHRAYRLYTALHFLTDDSCCVRLDTIKNEVIWLAFPFGDMSESAVQAMLESMDKENLIWKYEAEGIPCAYLPEARSFVAQGRGVWNEPSDVPLPPGIAYVESPNSNHNKRGRYTFPNTREQLTGSFSEFSRRNISEEAEQWCAEQGAQGAQGAQGYE